MAKGKKGTEGEPLQEARGPSKSGVTVHASFRRLAHHRGDGEKKKEKGKGGGSDSANTSRPIKYCSAHDVFNTVFPCSLPENPSGMA